MKINHKWLLWFSLVGIYCMLMGGIFYYQLFKWTFDSKLKQDILEMVRSKASELHKGLLRSPAVITFDEVDIMEWIRSDAKITDILYLNSNGTVRWHKKGQYIGMPFDKYFNSVGLTTNAVELALQSGEARIKEVPKKPFYDVAIPLKAKEIIIGLICLQVSRETSANNVRSAMVKYSYGALLILALLGGALYIFQIMYVLNPLLALKDSIENISPKSFEIKFANRNDEIGELAVAINGLLEQVRSELSAVGERDKQRQVNEQAWWQSVLSAAVLPGIRALVVDEDNTVLYANFQVNRLDPTQKLHLLDIVDGQQQDMLRLISVAMDTPNKVVEGDTVFRGQPTHVRTVQLFSENNAKRTFVLFYPKAPRPSA